MNKNNENFENLSGLPPEAANYIGTPLCNSENNSVYIPEITYPLIFGILYNSILGNPPSIKDITTGINFMGFLSITSSGTYSTIFSNLRQFDLAKVEQAYAISIGCLFGMVICSASALAFLICQIIASEKIILLLLVVNFIGIGVLYYIGNSNLELVNKTLAIIIPKTPCNNH
jgi:drug/metabolite transporter (DMT)-like permease